MSASDDSAIDTLAQTLCAAFHADHTRPASVPVWNSLSPLQHGNWRRAARTALLAIEGNLHWLPGHERRSRRVADLLMSRGGPTAEAWRAFSDWMGQVEALLDGDTDEVDSTTWTEWYAEGLTPPAAKERYVDLG